MHFLEVILQLRSLNKEEALGSSVQLLKRFTRLYLDESMRRSIFQNIALGASAECRIILFTGKKDDANQHILEVADIFETLSPLGPRRPGTAPNPKIGWSTWDFQVFQGFLTAYIMALTQVFEMSDHGGMTLSEEQFAALLQGSKRVIRTSWCLQLDENFTTVAGDIENRWYNLPPDKLDSLIGRWIQTMATAIHREAKIEDGKRIFRFNV